jgi:hypothetical protein
MADDRDDGRSDGLLARWSRRKQAARKGEADQEAVSTGVEKAKDAVPEEPAPTDLELPDPATLDASSDFKPFLRPGVPVETQRAALRRLWRLDPIYNYQDGLDDYCEDYTDKAKVVKGLRTAYRVGRGFLDQIDKTVERAAPDEAKLAAPAATGEDDSGAPAVQKAALEPKATATRKRERRQIPKPT